MSEQYIYDKLNERTVRRNNALSRYQDHYLMVDKYDAFTSIIDCANSQEWDKVQKYLEKHPSLQRISFLLILDR